MVEEHVRRWNDEAPVTAEDMGRAASKVESTEEVLGLLEAGLVRRDRELGRNYAGQRRSANLEHQFAFGGHPGEVVGVSNYVPTHLAKSVEAERLRFCEEPSFDAAPFLSSELRDIFVNPLDHAVAPDDEMHPPRVNVRCSARERLKLLEKLDSSGRLSFMRPSEVRMRFRNGLFAVPKDGERDRMVLDARPPNLLEDAACPWINTLASVSQLEHVFLREEEEMRLFAEDLREFYHAFLISEQRTRRNALACEVRPEQVAHFRCFKEVFRGEKALVPCLGTMAMGDCHAVTMGQVSHLAVLLRTRAVCLDDFIMLHSRPSRKHWLAGLMIDDLVLLERRVSSQSQAVDHESSPPSTCEQIIEEVRKKYEEVGLPRHAGKAVHNSVEGTFWGVQFDGVRGEVRPSLKRSIPLAFILQRVIELRVATVGLLEALAGSLVAVFQTKRRFMSLLEEIYIAQRGRCRKDIVALSLELQEELLLAAALVPLTSIDFRLRASPHLVASDASTEKEAAVFCEVGCLATEELHRHTLQKGLWNRLLNPLRAYRREVGDLDPLEELPDRSFEEMYGMHPLWEEIVSSQQFFQLGPTLKNRQRQHINIKEIRAAIKAEQEEGRLHPGSFYVHLQDSQVSLACLLKGRSSSCAANRELQRSIPLHVTQRIRPFYGYVRSKRNPSDDPTRNQRIRRPTRPVATWFSELQQGRTEELDGFLSEQGVHPSQTRGTPEEMQLWPDPPVLLESGLSRRKARRKKAVIQECGHPSTGEKAGGGDDDENPGDGVPRQRPAYVEAEEGPLVELMSAEAVDAEAADAEAERGPLHGIGIAEAADTEVESTEAENGKRGKPLDSAESRATQKRGERSGAAGNVSQEKVKRRSPVKAGEDVAGAKSINATGVGAEDLRRERAQRLSIEVIEELFRFPQSQFVFSEEFGSLEEALHSGPGILDLFAGSRGLSKACCRSAPTWSLCFDISHSPSENLLVVSLQNKLTKLVGAGAFFAMVAGPVCSSFSSAITPPTRTLLHPEGVPWASELQHYKNEQGNDMLLSTLKMVRACVAQGILFVVENPDSSWMWRQTRKELSWDGIFAADPKAGDLRLDFCRFGTAWRKRTRFRCNLVEAGQKIFCQCKKPHVILRGRCKAKGVNYTKLAEPYPRLLCGALAGAILNSAGFFGECRPLDLASCAKVTNRRIGEAAHPGPRRRGYQPHRGTIDLSEVELLEPATVKLRAKVWDRFLSWSAAAVGSGVAEQWLIVCQPLFVQLAVAFGYSLFHGGESLHLYRQFLAHLQREHPSLRLHLSRAWLVVTKWEKVEPTVHRTPVPEALIKAMICLSWCWGWRQFAAVLAFTFYSVSRVGEVLRARRAHVLTPKDLLYETQTVYLRIMHPKTRNRGARTQYSSTEVELCVNLVSEVWDRLLPDQLLYGGSPSAFRTRWNAVLKKLNIPASLHLTPGSLRGGGAIAAYRRGVPIEQLMWMMRVLHQKTLGFYLQEMVAASILPSLPGGVLAQIRLLQCILPFLVKSGPAAP